MLSQRAYLGATVFLCVLGGGCGDDEQAYVGPAFFTNVLVNQDDSVRAQNETTIAINPSDRGNLVGGWNDYRLGEVTIGYGATLDGGQTWVDGVIPEPGHAAQGDPAVAAGRDGTFYMAMISFERDNNEGGVYVARSDNNGVTFNTPVAVQADPVLFEDKEYITVDNAGGESDGHVYLSWTDFDPFGTTRIVLSRSSDRGQSWSRPSQVASGFVQGSVPAVGALGVLYVTWYEIELDDASLTEDQRRQLRQKFGPHSDRAKRSGTRRAFFGLEKVLDPILALLPGRTGRVRGGVIPPSAEYEMEPREMFPFLASGQVVESIYVARSEDGGQTFSERVQAATLLSVLPVTFRTNSFPSIAVSLTKPGRLYLTYSDASRDDGDIFVVRSDDGGQSFDAPVRVNDDGPGAYQVFPWIAADKEEEVHVIWYDRRDDPHLLHLYYASSTDQGRSFSANRAVSSQPFDPDTNFDGGFIGDYNALAAFGGVGYALWMDSRRGEQDIFFAALD